MSKDHDETRLQDHIVGDVRIIASHHNHRLLPRYPLAHVLLVLPPIHLTSLQRLQTGRPPSLVSILHQLIDYVARAPGLL